jgi:hypothetical protein
MSTAAAALVAANASVVVSSAMILAFKIVGKLENLVGEASKRRSDLYTHLHDSKMHSYTFRAQGCMMYVADSCAIVTNSEAPLRCDRTLN